jgi:hypothetical protein
VSNCIQWSVWGDLGMASRGVASRRAAALQASNARRGKQTGCRVAGKLGSEADWLRPGVACVGIRSSAWMSIGGQCNARGLGTAARPIGRGACLTDRVCTDEMADGTISLRRGRSREQYYYYVHKLRQVTSSEYEVPIKALARRGARDGQKSRRTRGRSGRSAARVGHGFTWGR